LIKNFTVTHAVNLRLTDADVADVADLD